MSRPVLGIDLGTTNSVVASIDDQGRVVILRNALGSEITPSVVFFEPGGVVVGEEALQALTADPGSGVRPSSGRWGPSSRCRSAVRNTLRSPYPR